MSQSFEAQISAHVANYKNRLKAVVKNSAQHVFSVAQRPKAQGGNLPVLTGFLRGSFISGLNGSTAMTGPDVYEMVISGYELGDSIFGGWTANYALRREHGFNGYDSLGRAYNETGDQFMNKAAAEWVPTVHREAARFPV